MKNYTLVENKNDGSDALKLTSGPYSGIIYRYDKVEFRPKENEDRVILHFEYKVLDNASKGYDVKLFEKYIGDILIDLIDEGIVNNTITYRGGIDEDRKEDSKQSDK